MTVQDVNLDVDSPLAANSQIASSPDSSPIGVQSDLAPVSNRSPEQSVIEAAAAEIDPWQEFQTNARHFWASATSSTREFFYNNRRLFNSLGWILLALLGVRILFAVLAAIDDLPLVTPILKLIGLVYVVQFTRRYLIREQDRQELVHSINRTKQEFLGR